MTAKEQSFREAMRLQAADRFARGEKSSVIAAELRVSVRSVERWRRAWQEGGTAALRSSGPAKRPYLDREQFAEHRVRHLETQEVAWRPQPQTLRGPGSSTWSDLCSRTPRPRGSRET
ncbi:helix-turn-helix domain-containing protein [Streptomyces sp. NPDC001796]|uniref:helix-turn-helix domain-containing protein n=1 Tax=Streptomyces sp. NPDC001796 TaxID=3364609 RepID=UPI0036A60FBB